PACGLSRARGPVLPLCLVPLPPNSAAANRHAAERDAVRRSDLVSDGAANVASAAGLVTARPVLVFARSGGSGEPDRLAQQPRLCLVVPDRCRDAGPFGTPYPAVRRGAGCGGLD